MLSVPYDIWHNLKNLVDKQSVILLNINTLFHIQIIIKANVSIVLSSLGVSFYMHYEQWPLVWNIILLIFSVKYQIGLIFRLMVKSVLEIEASLLIQMKQLISRDGL